MQRKVDKKTAKTIISLAFIGAITALLSQQWNFGSKALDQDVDSLLFAIGVSLMGIIFWIMRKKNLGKYAAESFELLFFLILPVIAFIPILGDPSIHFAFFFPVYYGGVNAWLLASKHFIFDPIDTDEKKVSWSGIKQLWGFLMLLSVLIYPFYFLWLESR